MTTYKFIRTALLVVCAMMLTACNNIVDLDGWTSPHDIPNTGAPVIKAVYAVADVNMQTPLTAAEMGQSLAIVGENLNRLQSLKFNTVETDLNQTYTQSTKAVVTVPDTYSKNHENVIEYTTDMGSVKYSFYIALPAAEVGGLLNEFAEPGTNVAVNGENLEYYDFTLTLDDKELPLSVEGNTLSFNIPQGTPDNSVFVISWIDAYGEQQTVNMPFRPTSDMLFDDISKAEQEMTDRNVSIETGDLGTSCLHFSGTISEYAWVELSFEQPLAETYEAENVNLYNFVFEVKTAEGHPLLDTGYEFALNWDWDNSYRWNPETLDTEGGWQTVRCSLEQIAPNGLSAVDGKMTLNVGFQPYQDYDADFYLANFRIVKK
ncbi:MAG: hypothetical protein IJV13_10260 [Prevotella sp.]|nr:hypothetical protein [Prevotella sp.]